MAAGAVMAVVLKGEHALGYYDFETGAELGRVAVDPFPHEFTLDPEGRRAYLAHFGVALAEDHGPGGHTVSVVDLAARRRVGTVECGEYRRPHDVAFDAAGRLYVLSEGAGRLLVLDDPASGRIDRVLPTGGDGSHKLAVLASGAVAFSSNMYSNTVSALFPQEPERPPVVIPVGRRPEGSVFDPEERRLFVMNREDAQISVVDVGRLSVTATIAVPPGPVRVWRTPEGCLLVALYHDRSLAVLDPAGRVSMRVPLPERPISIGYHAPSRTALLSTHAHEVCCVDLACGTLARTIKTGRDPDPMVVLS
jgi:YVTN family beta-propeller protein